MVYFLNLYAESDLNYNYLINATELTMKNHEIDNEKLSTLYENTFGESVEME